MTQFQCHIGHRYTAEVMVAAQILAMERFIESAMRSMNERAELCREMAEKVDAVQDGKRWLAAMGEARDQTAPLRALLEREWIQPPFEGLSRPPSEARGDTELKRA